jgi:TonB family protein
MRQLGRPPRALIFLLMSCAVAAAPGPGSSQPPASTPPDWIRPPTMDDVASVYPAAAVRKGADGSATVNCLVTVEGVLRDCVVEKEIPKGLDFGAAAIVLVRQLGMRPATRNGAPIESRVSIPVQFIGGGTPTGSHIRGTTTLGAKRVVTGVVWSKAPTFEAMSAAFPARARERKLTGRASLNCTIADDRSLKACSITNEDPRGMGFGAAARTLTDSFQAPAQAADGRSLSNTSVQIPFTFSERLLQGSGPARITTPKWVTVPTNAEFGGAFPAQARAAKVFQSRVVVECAVSASGGLESCRVATETPANLGFGQAALTLASKFVLSPWSEDGLPTAGSLIRLPLGYDVNPDAVPEAQPPGAAAAP